jgi:hypothetical protein
LDIPFTFILLAVERDMTCTSILLAVEVNIPCTFILLVLLVVKGIHNARPYMAADGVILAI